MEKTDSMSLNEAAGAFLASLEDDARQKARPVVTRFVAWYGRDKYLAAMIGSEVARYADQMSRTEVDLSGKLSQLRAFLVFTHKKGWLKTSMAVHVKVAKAPAKKMPQRLPAARPVSETKRGAEKLQKELEELKKKRVKTVEDLSIAAADKDLRENAPYHAAREQLSHIDGRIKEIEATLKVLLVVDGGQEVGKCAKIGLGHNIVLKDLSSGEELEYSIVGPKEVDPLKGRISPSSPIGRAAMGRCAGDEIEVVAPARKLRYRVEKISR